MGISERKERERGEMRQRILDAALNLFIAEGYENVSLRRIAERIEYSAATIYLYFRDKDDVFFALLRQGFDALLARQEAVQEIPEPRERLLAHGRAYVTFAMDHPRLYEIMFVMHGPVKAMLRENDFAAAGNSYNLLRRNVRECAEAGFFAGENPEVVAFTLWSLVHGVSSLAISGRLKMVPVEMLRMLVEGFKDYLSRFVAFESFPKSARPPAKKRGSAPAAKGTVKKKTSGANPRKGGSAANKTPRPKR